MRSSSLEAARHLIRAIRQGRSIHLRGARGCYPGALLSELARAGEPWLVVVADDVAAQRLKGQLDLFLGRDPLGLAPNDAQHPDGHALIVPELDMLPWADRAIDPRMVGARLAALEQLLLVSHARSADSGEPSPKGRDHEGGSRQRPGPPGQGAPAQPVAQRTVTIASVGSLMRRVVPRELFTRHRLELVVGHETPRDELIASLDAAGYLRAELVEDPGTYAVRGNLVDVFPPRERFPARIEWWGDEIERMRSFDPESQRGLRALPEIAIHPVRETIATSRSELRARVFALADQFDIPSAKSRAVLENLDAGVEFFGREALAPAFCGALDPLWSYLPDGLRWCVLDDDACIHRASELQDQVELAWQLSRREQRLACPPDQFFVDVREMLTALEQSTLRIGLFDEGGAADEEAAELAGPPTADTMADLAPSSAGIERASGGGTENGQISIALRDNVVLRRQLAASRQARSEPLRPLVELLRSLGAGAGQSRAPWEILVVAPSSTEAEQIVSLLQGMGLQPSQHDAGVPLTLAADTDATATRLRVALGHVGFGYCDPDARVCVVGDEDWSAHVRSRAARRRTSGLASLSQLAPGSFVVHHIHGIAAYEGLTQLTTHGVPTDFVVLQYAGKDRLYLPVHRIGEIERYSMVEGVAPKLDKMGGQSFAVRTRKVRDDVRQMADELLQIYAQREALEGFAFPPADDLYNRFEGTFPFVETPDQQQAIDAVQRDLGRPSPMDRVVCGDVGFGKTEVALRAAFRVAAAGQQVAVLAPTTVLVQQHFLNFAERMNPFPVNVGALHRFVLKAREKATIDGIASGDIDVVVGTHRLLSRDVRFARLGLLIIDEEHRFGVAQKERFKKLKSQVDVLTLTATPIPRTLHMSLLGLREISLIQTPPVDRLAVRTSVARHSDQLIQEAITKELARGGQVFYVVPRILGIDERARRIRELVPDARVLVGHGQMPGDMLERTMLDFIEHRADVLVCTTIIESGIDIPRANTMLIESADQFGLAQLHQLRGRIGRSKLRAFCYLMVQAQERLSGEASRRLDAIASNSELGAGFSIASHDLEIRGAGELLGARQSGNIHAVGFEAYARILEEAVAELRGTTIAVEHDPELLFDIPAFLPDHWIEDVGQRLEFYRRLALAKSVDEVHDLMLELHDRYGEAPEEARRYGVLMACRRRARSLGIVSFELRKRRLTLRVDARRVGERLRTFAAAGGQLAGLALRAHADGRLTVDLPESEADLGLLTLERCEAVLTALGGASSANARS